MSSYILHDDEWKMTENYNEWSHREMLLWFQGLNDGFYSEYEDAFEDSKIDGRDFEKMQNSSFLEERFGMEHDIASELAHVVERRVTNHSAMHNMVKPTELINNQSLEPTQLTYKSHENENSLALTLPSAHRIFSSIECECCGNVKLDQQNLYQCTEVECRGTKSDQIFCKKCFDIYHNTIFQRNHQFDINNENIICINDMLDSFRNYEYENGENAPLQMKRFRKFNRIQNWFGTLTSVLTASAGEATTYLHYSAEMMASITEMSGEIVLSTLSTALLGGGVGAALSLGIEFAVIFWRYYNGKIETPLELCRLLCKSSAGHAVAFGGFMGGFVGTTAACGAIGGVMGGPIGAGVGIVVGILFGLVLRRGANWIFDKVWESKENNDRIDHYLEMKETALHFFQFGSDVSIIQNEKIYNKKEITRRYHRYALLHHPDMNVHKSDDEKEEINITWLALCSYYSILTAMCDERDNNTQSELVEDVNNIDINEEYLSLLDH